MSKILLLGAGTQALAIVKPLAKVGHKVNVLYGHSNYANRSRYVSKRFTCYEPMVSEKYLINLEALIAKEKIDVLIPMGDIAAEFLSKNKERLSKIVKFTIPDYPDFMQGYDKNRLMALCKEKGYPHPQTIDISRADNLNSDELKEFPYPAMLKPNRTTGGRGMVMVNSFQELLEKYPSLHKQYGNYHLQQFIPQGGRQIKIQLCVDNDGRELARSAMRKVRWFPIKAGSSCCSVSIVEEKATEVCLKILRDLHWKGFADFDLIEDPSTKKLLIMEINPRLPACLGAAVHAGMNWGQIIVDQALGGEPKHYEYKQGVVLRHLGFDFLWFLKSPTRFSATPSWFHFMGRNVHYQDLIDWTDPMPFLSGTYNNIKKLFDPSIKKAKSL